jgi:hypothetical protein
VLSCRGQRRDVAHRVNEGSPVRARARTTGPGPTATCAEGEGSPLPLADTSGNTRPCLLPQVTARGQRSWACGTNGDTKCVQTPSGDDYSCTNAAPRQFPIRGRLLACGLIPLRQHRPAGGHASRQQHPKHAHPARCPPAALSTLLYRPSGPLLSARQPASSLAQCSRPCCHNHRRPRTRAATPTPPPPSACVRVRWTGWQDSAQRQACQGTQRRWPHHTLHTQITPP